MAKVVRNVSLDYDVVEEFRLTQQKGKLSGVINELLRNYLNVQKNELQPKQKLENRKKKILEKKAVVDAELLEIRSQLLEHETQQNEYDRVKEKFWTDIIRANFPNYNREKYDACYDEKFYQKALQHSGVKQ